MSPRIFRIAGGDAFLATQANAFLRSLEIRSLSPCTVRAYGFDLIVLMRWLISSGTAFENLSQALLLDFIEAQKQRSLSGFSINRRLSTCSQFFRFVLDKPLPRGTGVTLPAANYKGQGYDYSIGMHWRRRSGELSLRVKTPHKLIEPLARDEVVEFIKTMRSYRDLCIIFAMVLAGLRSKEVISLQGDDINFARNQMLVRGKGNKQRLLPLAPGLVDLVKRYLDYERPLLCPAPALFVNLQGQRLGEAMTSRGLISLFTRRREKNGLKRANPHRFRHTFGADMARAGMHLLVIQKLMGHADPRMTTKYIELDISDVALEYQKTMARIGEKYAHKTPQTT